MEGGLDVGLWEHDPPTNWENSDTHPGYNEKISKKHLKCISRASVSHYKVHVALDLTARPSAATPAKATAQHLRAIHATETAILVGGRRLLPSALSRARGPPAHAGRSPKVCLT